MWDSSVTGEQSRLNPMPITEIFPICSLGKRSLAQSCANFWRNSAAAHWPGDFWQPKSGSGWDRKVYTPQQTPRRCLKLLRMATLKGKVKSLWKQSERVDEGIMKHASRESPLKRIRSVAFDCAHGRSSCVMNEKGPWEMASLRSTSSQ